MEEPKQPFNLTKLIGIPYDRMDCFDLVKKFYKEYFDSEVFSSIPSADDNWEREVLIQSHKGRFKEVKSPKYGDIVIIKIHGLECHLGIFLGHNSFLHTTKTTGSCICKIGRWQRLITGYYTLDGVVSGNKN